jgi:hypothetical protein
MFVPQGMTCPFQLLLTDFVFFYVKFTVFRRGHTGFATIGTLVIIFISVTIMVLLRTLETNNLSFALALSMFKFLTFEAAYRVWNIWVYPDAIMTNANGD